MKTTIKAIVLIIVLSLFITGCASVTKPAINENQDNVKDVENQEEVIKEDGKEETDSETKEETDSEVKEDEEKQTVEELDYKEVKPNEVGKVMVIMYHSLDETERDWVRSYDNFKEDLQLLNDRGYTAVSLKDYVNNTMNVPAGKSPVVITFDDGNKSDFEILNEDMEINPNSAVAILEEFAKNNPEFGLEATFFVNGGSPFRQKEYVEYKLNYIIDKGMDIGNHTLQHEKLGSQSKDEIQGALAKNVASIKKYLPNYEVNTLALPHGSRPSTDEKERTDALYKGEFEGTKYENIVALAVGWDPNVAPVSKKFDTRFVHRVQGSSVKFGLRYWMDYLDENPSQKYISDGILDVISVPKKRADLVDETKLNGKVLKVYKINEAGEVTVE